FKAIETEAAESVASCLSKEREKEILENRQYVKALLKTTALLGRQGLAFRGHDEGESSANQGNFVETVHLLTEINPDLMKNSHKPYNGWLQKLYYTERQLAKYLSLYWSSIILSCLEEVWSWPNKLWSSLASQFTDVQMEDLRASFALFDQDGDGHITTSELTAVMKCLGQNPTDAEILAIIKEVDADGNGTIEFSEFVIAMAKSVNDIDSEKEIKEAFDVFDKDGNGHINVEELRYVSVNLGETFSDEDIAEMLKQADFDGDGVVNYKGMTEAL
ncbi:hypothetical protein QYM36_009342, partial [Artemia franciscana]